MTRLAARLAALDPSPTRDRRAAVDLGVLAAIGAGVVAASAWTTQWPRARDHATGFALATLVGLVLWAAGGLWIWRRRPRAGWALLIVLAASLGGQLVQVPLAPDVSGDIYRYVWDGRVQAEGINPYRYAPNDPTLLRLRDDAVHPSINRPGVPTIYPPVAQATFAAVYAVHPDSVTWTKLAMVLLNGLAVVALAAALLLLGSRPERTLLYAWHPLAILEVGRSGHVDAVAVLGIALALVVFAKGRQAATGALLALATLVKPYAALLLAGLARQPGSRRWWRAPAAFFGAAAVAYLPYLSVGSGVLGYLSGYVEEEGFASGTRYHLLAMARQAVGAEGPPGVVTQRVYEVGAALVLGGVALAFVRRPPASTRVAVERAALPLLVALLVASPAYPWYALTLCALLPVVGGRLLVPAAIVCSGAPFIYLDHWLPSHPDWPLDLTWGAGALALLIVAALTVRRVGPPWRPMRRGPGRAAPSGPRPPARPRSGARPTRSAPAARP